MRDREDSDAEAAPFPAPHPPPPGEHAEDAKDEEVERAPVRRHPLPAISSSSLV